MKKAWFLQEAGRDVKLRSFDSVIFFDQHSRPRKYEKTVEFDVQIGSSRMQGLQEIYGSCWT